MKVKVKAHIFYAKYDWEEVGEYQLWFVKIEDEEHRTYIGSQEFEIDVPDKYDPRAQQIAALEKEKEKVMADYQKTVTGINNRINNLKAITA
jgi:hypothetical protein